MVSRSSWVIGLPLLTLVSPDARAQDVDYVDKASKAIARACAGQAGKAITPENLARGVLIETSRGVDIGPVAEPIAEVTSPEQYPKRSTEEANDIRAVHAILREYLSRPETKIGKALAAAPKPPPYQHFATGQWLFIRDSRYTLTCAAPPGEKTPSFDKVGPVIVRKGVADLAKVGDDKITAGAAQIAVDDLRTTNLAGDERRTVKLVINAAAAVTLGAGTVDRYAILYGEYSRSRARVRTAPEPTVFDKDGRADDIDSLELGLLGTRRFTSAVRATGRVGVIIDSITGARFAAGNVSAAPITGGGPNLGLCNMGTFKSLGLGIVARCNFLVEADLRQVLKAGRADLTASDRLFALGGSAGIELGRGLDKEGQPQDGLTSSLTYRYLNMVSGPGPNIDRFDASLAYRWWSDDLGFDFGLIYSDGIERKSLADEHRIALTFGIIY